MKKNIFLATIVLILISQLIFIMNFSSQNNQTDNQRSQLGKNMDKEISKLELEEMLASKIINFDMFLDTIAIGTGENQALERARNNFSKNIKYAKKVLSTETDEENLIDTLVVLEQAKINFLKTINIKKPSKPSVYNNPLYQGQDPFVTCENGYYYYVTANNNSIILSKSRTLLDQGEKVEIVKFDDSIRKISAPKILYVKDKWYIYYSAVFKAHGNRNYIGVLESASNDPFGKYIDKGILDTGRNLEAKNFTLFKHDSNLYGVWDSFHVDSSTPFVQTIAKMNSPTEISETRISLNVKNTSLEYPSVLVSDTSIYITVSAGDTTTKDYHLAAFIYNGSGDILDKNSWVFEDNIFNGNMYCYGPGRACFIKSLDGNENYFLYQSKVYYADNNGWSQINLQKFTWKDDEPVLGEPISISSFQPLPSGDFGIGEVYQAEDAFLIGGATKDFLYRGFQGEGYVSIGAYPESEINFVVDVPEANTYYMRMRYTHGLKVEGEYESWPIYDVPANGKLNVFINGSYFDSIEVEKTNITWESWFYKGFSLPLDRGKNVITLRNDEGDAGNINVDYIAIDEGSRKNNAAPEESVNFEVLYLIVTALEIVLIVVLVKLMRKNNSLQAMRDFKA